MSGARLLALLTAAVAALVTSCAPRQPPRPAAAQATLAVVSWNMRAGTGDLPRLTSEVASGRLTGAPVSDYVLLIQEATERVVGEAAGSGRGAAFTFFAPVRRGPDRTTGNAIVSTLPLLDARAIPLPRERQPRAAATATIEVAGTRLFVASVHLENRLGWLRGLFGDRARRRQADALLEALPIGAHGILGGDMNTMLGPGEPALDALFERFPDTPPAEGPPTFGDRLRLDYLFFDLPDGWDVSQRVLEDGYGSDHLPVLGSIDSRR